MQQVFLMDFLPAGEQKLLSVGGNKCKIFGRVYAW
jgi:hypothetical protein